MRRFRHPLSRRCVRAVAGLAGPRAAGRRAEHLVRDLPREQRLAPRRLEPPGARRRAPRGSARRTRGPTLLHPDFGPPSYGIPFDAVAATHPKVSIALPLRERERSRAVPVRRGHPHRRRIRPPRDHDRPERLHAVRAVRRPLERRRTHCGQWRDLPSRGAHANDLRPAGWTSADAAGLPIFAGLLRYDEVAAGVVDHAIRMTVDCTYDAYIWPARHAAGTGDHRCPRWGLGSGSRLRSRSSVRPDGAGDPPCDEALRHDRGGQRERLVLPGHRRPAVDEPPARPAQADPREAFQAVDERACRLAPGSAAFAYGPVCPAP